MTGFQIRFLSGGVLCSGFVETNVSVFGILQNIEPSKTWFLSMKVRLKTTKEILQVVKRPFSFGILFWISIKTPKRQLTLTRGYTFYRSSGWMPGYDRRRRKKAGWKCVPKSGVENGRQGRRFTHFLWCWASMLKKSTTHSLNSSIFIGCKKKFYKIKQNILFIKTNSLFLPSK